MLNMHLIYCAYIDEWTAALDVTFFSKIMKELGVPTYVFQIVYILSFIPWSIVNWFIVLSFIFNWFIVLWFISDWYISIVIWCHDELYKFENDPDFYQ